MVHAADVEPWLGFARPKIECEYVRTLQGGLFGAQAPGGWLAVCMQVATLTRRTTTLLVSGVRARGVRKTKGAQRFFHGRKWRKLNRLKWGASVARGASGGHFSKLGVAMVRCCGGTVRSTAVA